MERLTYDFAIGDRHCWEVHGADNLVCADVCKNQGDKGCEGCPIREAIDRLASYENTERTPEEVEELGCVKGKLDTAIEDIPHTCEYCAYNGVDVDVAPCADCEQMNTLFGEERWEWRGMKEG